MAKSRGALGYSYMRFSRPEQGEGDSLRRQTAKRDAWLKKNGVKLDTSVSLQDKGISAFTGEHRSNPDRHALAAFLELVKQGRIPRGSFLIVENLDRLSREHIRPALTLLLNLIDAGIRVVQLLPVEMVYDESAEPMTLMMAIMELSRGHSESVVKSERVGDAWQQKKQLAAEKGEPLTARCPAWLRLVDGKWEVIEEAAEAVRLIFRWAIEGHGIGVITKKLNADDVPAISTGKRAAQYWARSYVAKILANRATIGEYQPYKGRGKRRRPDGDPIPHYYPAVVREEDFFAARAALANRKNKAGRLAKAGVNVFAHLLRDARDGGSVHQIDKGKKAGGRSLVSYRAIQGAGHYVSFPLTVFEDAVFSCLRELNPRELLPQKDRSADKVMALSGQLEETEGRIERLKAKLLDSPEVDSLVDVLRTLDGKRKGLAEDLAAARQRAASPLVEAWGQARSLIDVLDRAPDQAEVRVRLRAALRRIVDSIWILVVRRGVDRVCAVQIWFNGCRRHRDYLIWHTPARGGSVPAAPSKWSVRSLATTTRPGALDLRKREDVERLEAALLEVEWSEA